MRRGTTKRLLRAATAERIRLEREVWKAYRPMRFEEGETRKLLKDVPSVFAIAARMNPKYQPPLWASSNYGAR